MLDIPLGYELALIIAISAGIAWLMGRAFCKSKEHQVQAHLDALQTKYKQLEALTQQKDSELQSTTAQLHHLDKQYVELKHTHETDAALMQDMQQKRHETLAQLQDLEAYRVKFEHLQQSHDAQTKELLDLKTLHTQTQDALKKKDEQIAQQTQQLQQGNDHTVAIEQDFASQKAALKTTIIDKDTQIANLTADKKILENEVKRQRADKEAISQQAENDLQQQLADKKAIIQQAENDLQQQLTDKKAIIQQAENDKQVWQAASADQQAQFTQQLRAKEDEVIALQHQYQNKAQYHDKLQQKKSALQLRHKKQLQKMQMLTAQVEQQSHKIANKDALIKRLQQENQTLSLLNQQNSVKIEALNKELNVYWQTANATNNRISGMLKNLPARN